MAQQVSISLEKEHIRAVERYGKKIGVSKFSVALQSIINQFDQAQKAAEVTKPDGKTAEATGQAA